MTKFKINALFLIVTLGLEVLANSAQLTKTEIQRLKDYLLEQKQAATDKRAALDVELQAALDAKEDAGGQHVKDIKSAMFPLTDIIDHTDKLLEQLRTGKYDYSLVVAQLKSLGTNPQSVLKTTGVRDKLLSGQKIHALIVEIDAVNPERSTDEIDEAFLKQKIGKQSDKRMMYIATDLTDRLYKKHGEITDLNDLKTGITILRTYLVGFQNDTTIKAVQKRPIVAALNKLVDIENARLRTS